MWILKVKVKGKDYFAVRWTDAEGIHQALAAIPVSSPDPVFLFFGSGF